MFAFIKGEVLILSDTIIAVIAGGVGYEINISRRVNVQNGDITVFYLHLIHKEDSMALYGFETKEEKKMFITLLKAQGIGAKLAMETLSTYSIKDIMDILFTKDIMRLKKISGMGAKKAEKLLFDLRDKIEKIDIQSVKPSNYNTNESDTLKALMSLGFSNIEANQAISNIENRENITAEVLIGLALKQLSKL